MKFNMKKTILSAVLLLSFFYKNAQAQIPLAIPFGGPILMSYECLCSGGWFVMTYDYTIKMPVPMTFQFGESMLRANYNIFTESVQTVGSYTSGGICLMASLDCGGFYTQGTISPIGLPGIGTGAI